MRRNALGGGTDLLMSGKRRVKAGGVGREDGRGRRWQRHVDVTMGGSERRGVGRVLQDIRKDGIGISTYLLMSWAIGGAERVGIDHGGVSDAVGVGDGRGARDFGRRGGGGEGE